jgi:ribulose-5-phosphate 4-epimerase/fuculose-1-phosphate aldolase
MGAFLHGGVPIFEIREPGGMTDMLITSNYLGKSLAGSLGACSCVLMRGHGYSTVGDSITEAVYRAIYTDVNAQVQLQAHSLGGAINFLEDEEGRIATDTIRKTMDRPWELWKLEVRKKK